MTVFLYNSVTLKLIEHQLDDSESYFGAINIYLSLRNQFVLHSNASSNELKCIFIQYLARD